MRLLEISQLSLRYADTRLRDASRRARLAAAIAQTGQLAPVLVHPEGDAFVLVDGYARVDALKELGRDHVAALVLEMSPLDAILTRIRLQGGRRPHAFEDAWLLRALIDTHGLRSSELALKLERSGSWVSRRLALVEILPEPVQEAVRRLDIPPQGAMKSLVPLARANAEHCERLVTSLEGSAPSVRELDQLYRAWRDADPDIRERIVRHPQLFLRASLARQDHHATPPSPISDQLHALSERLADISIALEITPTDAGDRLLWDEWSRVWQRFDQLATRMDTLHARRRGPGHHPSTPQDGSDQPRDLQDASDLAQHRPRHHRERSS